MAEELYWVDGYVDKKRDSAGAMQLLKSGQRIFIGSACGEPQELVRALAERSCLFPGLEVVRMLSEESTPLTGVAEEYLPGGHRFPPL